MSDQIPGPGNYNIAGHLLKDEGGKKYQPHAPLQPKEVIKAEVGSYSPCHLNYNTFDRHALVKANSQNNMSKTFVPTVSDKKENKSPSPNTYSTISYWAGKSPNKKGQKNYFKSVWKGPTASIYH